MNKKDCEHLGYILSEYRASSDLLEAIFAMDDRIVEEYKGFEEVRGRSYEVDELAEELVERYNGKNWSMTKPSRLVKTFAECLEEARKEIYGDDYCPGMFKL